MQEHAGHPSSSKSSRSQARWKDRVAARKHHSSYMNVSSDTLWSDLKEFAKLKYQVLVSISIRHAH